jgi:hypothetical protein
MTAQDAWTQGFGRDGQAPLAWRDRYGNVYIDNQRIRVAELLGQDDATPARFEPLPDLNPPARAAPARPLVQMGEEAQIRPGEVRSVAEVITDPARAAQLYYQHASAGRFVRLMNSRAQHGWALLRDAWMRDYGGTGDPPIAWVDERGVLVVDAGRVDIPLGY